VGPGRVDNVGREAGLAAKWDRLGTIEPQVSGDLNTAWSQARLLACPGSRAVRGPLANGVPQGVPARMSRTTSTLTMRDRKAGLTTNGTDGAG
jgi:hypothetical protein